MTSIDKIIEKKAKGLCYGNRIIVPFKAHFLKIIVNDDIITDLSRSSKGTFIRENEDFTDIYFHDYKDLKRTVTKYENIKMVVVEKGKNIFNFDNHIKLALYLEGKHLVRIEKTDDDILFLE